MEMTENLALVDMMAALGITKIDSHDRGVGGGVVLVVGPRRASDGALL